MRNRNPVAIQELKGAYKKDPQRRPKDMPEPTGGIGPYKPDASVDESEVWDELVGIIAPGVLTNMDRVWVEMAVKLLILFRTGEITMAGIGQLTSILSKLGMNPSDRSKINIGSGGKPKSKFEDL